MKHHLVISIVAFLLAATSSCQNNVVVTNPASYGIDTTHNLIVWNTSNITGGATTLNFNGEIYQVTPPVSSFKKDEKYTLTSKNKTFTLYCSDLPLIKIKAINEIEDDPKVFATMTYVDKSMSFNGDIGIELRGNSALLYPKKSYDIELREAMNSETSIDTSFAGMRNDDDWILNSLYNEPLRLRSYFSNKLWLDIQQPHYLKEEDKASSGIDMAFVEVFVNNEYKGVYVFSEQVDRKLLKLKKLKENVVRGELFKGARYEDGTAFKAAKPFKNYFPHWNGYEVEYPYEDYEAHWDNLHAFVDFVVNANDEDFKNNIASKIVLDNILDYYLMINLLRATDNIGKNFFMARYDNDTPYFMVPWDLDGTLGTVIDGRKGSSRTDILSNNLFDRLIETNANGFKDQLKTRWQTLRSTHFSDNNLQERASSIYNKFTSEHIYDREQLIWQNLNVTEDISYLTQWITDRTKFLDTYFSNL